MERLDFGRLLAAVMGKKVGVTGRGLAAGAAVLTAVAALGIVRSGASGLPVARPPAPMQVVPKQVQDMPIRATPIRAMPMREPNVPPQPDKPNQAEVTSSPFTLTASVERAVLEGQPVVLALALHNGGTERLLIGFTAFEPSSFQITITDGAGRAVPRTADGERVLTPPTAVFANAAVLLNPDQTLRYRFNLARMFDLSRAGDYTVSASRIVSKSGGLRPLGGTPPPETTLAAGPLKFRMAEDAAVVSGPTALTPPRGHQTFLYMASRYNPGVSRYRVGADGSVSFTFDPNTPGLGTGNPAPSLGKGLDALVATPDGRYLYAGDNTVSQFRIGDDGVLSPLSPPKVPAQKFPGHLLMDPKGRFLYALSNWGNTRYVIGPDGRLTVADLMPAVAWGKDRDHTIVASDVGAIDPTGTFLYACNGLTYVYRLAPDGQVTALPAPISGVAGPNGGRENAIALSPTGKFAFVGVSRQNGSAFFDLMVPMRVAQDGTLAPIPGQAQTPQTPSYPKGFQPFQCSTLAVDPTGRFLVVLNPGFLDCYRIGPDGSLTSLGMTEQGGRLDSIFFVPGSPSAYVHDANTPSLLAFRLDEQRGLISAGLDMPNGVPFDAAIASAVAPTPPMWGPTVGGLDLSARLPADVLPTNAPVVLTVVLRNVTSRPIRLGAAGADMSSFRLSLTGPQRQSPGVLRGGGEPAAGAVPLLAAGHDLLDTPGTDGTALMLPPGGERQYRFVLSRLADLTVAGNYTIQVSRLLPGGATAASPVLHVLLEGPFNGVIRIENGSGLEVL
jgi:6-phosphogluconolactonase (cycloisomerase 2 family)